MNIFTIDNLKNLLTGDWIVLAVIGFLIFFFFKYRIPHIGRRFDEKMDKDACLILRDSCNKVLAAQMDKIQDRLTAHINSLCKKVDLVIDKTVKIEERTDKIYEKMAK